jgi:hypothetical protein
MDQGRLHLYQNGKLAAEGSGAVPLDEDATHLILGRLRTAAGGDGRQFAGRFDEVAIYDRALTPEEITSHVDLVRQH